MPDWFAIEVAARMPSGRLANNLNASTRRAGQTGCKTTESAECTLHYTAGVGTTPKNKIRYF